MNPLTILGPGNLDFWVRSDCSITIANGRVTKWADLSGHDNDLAFLPNDPRGRPDVDSPTYDTQGGPNGVPAVVFDGINDSLLNNTLGFRLPWYWWAVLKQGNWYDGGRLWISMDETTVTSNISQADLGIGVPNILQVNHNKNLFDVNSNNAGTQNVYFRLEAFFSNSSSDYLKVHSTLSTGHNSGADEGRTPGIRVGANQDPGAWSNIAIVELLKFSGQPSTDQRSQLDTYASGRYGAGVL
jgi:hypothetical protein